uniref:FF domain-containing protein n=1 Tax=Ditylenchus dipsaci TaxID=166011 RepID=A0A915DP02_9BILA
MSIIWNIKLFTKLSRSEARCNHCEKTVKMSGGSTKTLFTHARTHAEFEAKLKEMEEEQQIQLNLMEKFVKVLPKGSNRQRSQGIYPEQPFCFCSDDDPTYDRSAGLQSVGYAGFQTSIAGSLGSVSSGSSVVAAVNKDVNISKPVSSTAIPGTPWCVVWTGDKKVFFYNLRSKPRCGKDLQSSTIVQMLICWLPYLRTVPSRVINLPVNAKQSEEDKAEESGEEGSDADEDGEEPATKRTRQEKKADHLEKERKAKKEPVPVKEKPIDPVVQAELQAQQERNKIPLQGRLRKFRELLEDKNISGASIWEKELSKLVFDERYLLLCAAERKAAFEAKRAKEAKVEYKKLLAEADLHGKSSFTSFTKKYAKDPRFEALEKAQDREEYFRDFTKELYKLEKRPKRSVIIVKKTLKKIDRRNTALKGTVPKKVPLKMAVRRRIAMGKVALKEIIQKKSNRKRMVEKKPVQKSRKFSAKRNRMIISN